MQINSEEVQHASGVRAYTKRLFLMQNILPVTKNLLIINIIAFMAMLVAGKYGYGNVTDMLSLHFVLAEDFRIYQLVTYMFLHAGWLHLFFNMFALWMFGSIIENAMGRQKFIIFYFVCGIGAGIAQEVWQLAQYYMSDMQSYALVNTGGATIPMGEFLNSWATVGASGACYGVLLAFGMFYPEHRIMLLIPPIPIKAKYFVIGYIVLELVQAFTSDSNVAHFAHLGGMLFGWLLILYWRGGSGGAWGGGTGGRRRSQDYRYFFTNVKEKVSGAFRGKSKTTFKDRGADYEFNERRQKEREEVDGILAKIKRSGYESLTAAEKKKLFDNSTRE